MINREHFVNNVKSIINKSLEMLEKEMGTPKDKLKAFRVILMQAAKYGFQKGEMWGRIDCSRKIMKVVNDKRTDN